MPNFPSAFLMKDHKRRPPKRQRRESFVDYLRRVADDQEHLGRPATADDYRAAAARLQAAERALFWLEGEGQLRDTAQALALLKEAVR